MQDIFTSQSFISYHYTDINALIHILGKDYITLRATNCLYLNDSREIKEGIDSVKRVANVELQEGAFRNYYVTSFSDSDDELSMWGMYAANGTGCAIGFDMNEVQKYYGILARCTYGANKIDQNLSGFMNLYKNGSKVFFPNSPESKAPVEKLEFDDIAKNNLYLTICLGSKHESFRNEREVRCVYYNGNQTNVCFREKNGIIVPYVNLRMPKSVLKKIIIGPTNNSQLSLQSSIHFLAINGYDYKNIEVRVSKIPYRG
ncbi:DUF2971 domain-containing protein [Alistipes sp. cv1]|uniref:DUF2971 domain-containing protein n=1 Tax=Alistipes sp. cv1 TaxID=1622071 RepID=UPI0015E12DDB|nr:DUF2971 domain-containing protein [Alistipes sp. cv1]